MSLKMTGAEKGRLAESAGIALSASKDVLSPGEFNQLLNKFGITAPDKVSRLMNDEFNY